MNNYEEEKKAWNDDIEFSDIEPLRKDADKFAYACIGSPYDGTSNIEYVDIEHFYIEYHLSKQLSALREEVERLKGWLRSIQDSESSEEMIRLVGRFWELEALKEKE